VKRQQESQIEGARSISVWWTIGSAIIAACLTGGFTWGSTTARSEAYERDIAQNAQDISAVKQNVNESLKAFKEDNRVRFDKLGAKIDKTDDTMNSGFRAVDDEIKVLIRVSTRVAAKAGVSDE
jgi:hypothetical protein